MRPDTAQEAWNERYAGRDYIWTVEPNRFVEQNLADLEPGTAIDLGAGEGRNAVWLALQGWTVTAVDFSPVGLEKAARLARDSGVSIDLVEADATTYQPDALVDLVLIAYLQLPPESRRIILEHARSWLAPNGTLLIVAHDQTNVSAGHGGPSSIDVCYDLDETVAALSDLDIVTATVAERVVETDEGPQTALDTLVLARRPAG